MDIIWFNRRLIILEYLAIGFKKEFSKVPGNYRCFFCCIIVKFWVASQIFVYIMAFRSVYLTFFSYGKLDFILTTGESLNISRWSRLLFFELVARKSYDFKTFIFVFVIHLNQLSIVLISQTSFWGYIYYEYSLFTFSY